MGGDFVTRGPSHGSKGTIHEARTSLCWAALCSGRRNAVRSALGPAPRETTVAMKTVADDHRGLCKTGPPRRPRLTASGLCARATPPLSPGGWARTGPSPHFGRPMGGAPAPRPPQAALPVGQGGRTPAWRPSEWPGAPEVKLTVTLLDMGAVPGPSFREQWR